MIWWIFSVKAPMFKMAVPQNHVSQLSSR